MQRFFKKLVLRDKKEINFAKVDALITSLKGDCETLCIHTASALGQSKVVERILASYLIKLKSWYKDAETAFNHGKRSEAHNMLRGLQMHDTQMIALTNQLATINKLTNTLKNEHSTLRHILSELELKKEFHSIDQSCSDLVRKVHNSADEAAKIFKQI